MFAETTQDKGDERAEEVWSIASTLEEGVVGDELLAIKGLNIPVHVTV